MALGLLGFPLSCRWSGSGHRSPRARRGCWHLGGWRVTVWAAARSRGTRCDSASGVGLPRGLRGVLPSHGGASRGVRELLRALREPAGRWHTSADFSKRTLRRSWRLVLRSARAAENGVPCVCRGSPPCGREPPDVRRPHGNGRAGMNPVLRLQPGGRFAASTVGPACGQSRPVSGSSVSRPTSRHRPSPREGLPGTPRRVARRSA